MYLSFYSDDAGSQPDHRLPHARRPAQAEQPSTACSSADILGARTFAMRIWLKPDRMAVAQRLPHRCSATPSRAITITSPPLGATKGSMITVNLVANTDLQQRARNSRTSSSARTITPSSSLRDVANVVLGAEDYTSDVRFDGSARHVHGHLRAADFQHARCHPRRAQARARDREEPARRHARRRALRLDQVHRGRHPARCTHTLAETLLIVVMRYLPFPGQFPLGAHPGGRHPDLAHRHGVRSCWPSASRSTCSRCWPSCFRSV